MVSVLQTYAGNMVTGHSSDHQCYSVINSLKIRSKPYKTPMCVSQLVEPRKHAVRCKNLLQVSVHS